MQKGFITLEGCDGAGKTTQATRLCAHLRTHSQTVVETREPGGAAGADEIRNLLVFGDTERWSPVAETMLFYAARDDHLKNTILPALARGNCVVSDRFDDSTLAYQGYGRGVDRDFIERLRQAIVGDAMPGLTFILDLPPEQGLGRVATEEKSGVDAQETGKPLPHDDRYERMDKSMHERVRQGFLEIAATAPERCVIIDADQPEDVVAGAIAKQADRFLAASCSG